MTPKFDLLGIVVDSVVEAKIQDATIIPITINYEKVLEAETYPLELLGEDKVRESLFRVLNATKILSANQGRVYVEFG
jgi:glycerone phosphate O-acyltransferase/fatty acyl-CoA reductase